MRLYVIFTDGINFYHQSTINLPDNCRTAYFSVLDFYEWKEKELPKLSKELAETLWNNWEKNKEKST